MVKKNIPIRLKLLKNINNKSLMFMSVIKSHYDVDIDLYKYMYINTWMYTCFDITTKQHLTGYWHLNFVHYHKQTSIWAFKRSKLTMHTVSEKQLFYNLLFFTCTSSNVNVHVPLYLLFMSLRCNYIFYTKI